MSEIPEDIRKAAKAATGGWMTVGFPEGNLTLVDAVARAILAERERCAKIADEREAICADAVAKIGAGELYPNIPTAGATEECARLEAAHIARLIRGEPGAIRPSEASR